MPLTDDMLTTQVAMFKLLLTERRPNNRQTHWVVPGGGSFSAVVVGVMDVLYTYSGQASVRKGRPAACCLLEPC